MTLNVFDRFIYKATFKFLLHFYFYKSEHICFYQNFHGVKRLVFGCHPNIILVAFSPTHQ